LSIAADGDREVDIEIGSFLKEEIFGESEGPGHVRLVSECAQSTYRLCNRVIAEHVDIPIKF
jgi:hypothetical protein